jgi:CDP-glucose 4,6-dehydratase
MYSWLNKRVLVTGHTGFKGSWLSIWLRSLGAEVIGISDCIPTVPSLFEEVDHHLFDICDRASLEDLLRETKPDVVFHLAAQPIVLASYANPVATFETNVMGVVNVLDCIRQTPSVKAAVIITSDKCYENDESGIVYDENSSLGGDDPYSASKGAAEIVTKSYAKSFFGSQEPGKSECNVASARAGNVIGGGDWASYRLVPDIVESIRNGQKLEIRNPNAVRPWQHVIDPLSGYILLAEKLAISSNYNATAWNFGPVEGEEKTVLKLAADLIEAFGAQDLVSLEFDSSAKLHEATVLRLNSEKARAELNWRSSVPADELTESIAFWYRAKDAGDNIYTTCEKQIQKYGKL